MKILYVLIVITAFAVLFDYQKYIGYSVLFLLLMIFITLQEILNKISSKH